MESIKSTVRASVSVTSNRREYVVILSAEDLDSLQATIELLSDPSAQARVAQAEADIDRGEVTPLDEMTRIIQQCRRRNANHP